MAFAETWLHEFTPNSEVNIDGFRLYRGDRTLNSNKTRGGGVCLYVNECWAHPNNTTVTNTLCTPDIEVLTVNTRPYYLPREFTNVVFNVVYIPPQATKSTAEETLTNLITNQESKWPDSVILTLGDFNHTSLDRCLPHHTQYVTTPTRKDKIIDLFYCNVKDAYQSHSLPPLGDSDHFMLSMYPKYRPILKTKKVESKLIKCWSEESCLELQGCFDCTNWSIFIESCQDLDDLLFIVNSYIHFCENMIVPQKRIKLFPNNKPWLTKDMRQVILDKKKLRSNNYSPQSLGLVNKEIKKKVRESKKAYKSKIEESFKANDMCSVWQGLKKVSGYDCVKSSVNLGQENERQYVNELNKFYARFDKYDFTATHQNIRQQCKHSDTGHICFDARSVCKQFKCVNPKKASGPDNISGKIINLCAEQLSHIFSYIFNQSIKQQHIPAIWKRSKILPIPKKSKVLEMNDLRPVALTSIVFKCFEKLMLSNLITQVTDKIDPFQFAYRQNRGVEDALLVFLNNIYRHLDSGKRYVRALFIDFSSAFNTIQPHVLFEKLSKLGVSVEMNGWIFDFLTYRTQFVYLNNIISETIQTNTGAPQGCVLSPVLYSLYTNDFSLRDNVLLIKFADDSTLVGLICINEDEYVNSVQSFSNWCTENFLTLNTNKTKEIIFDFRKTVSESITPLLINNQKIEIVNVIKYLGITIDESLNWHAHLNNIYKKSNQRMYFLRKLNALKVTKSILNIFYSTTIQSIFTFGITCWGGNICEQDKKKINGIIKKASRICACELPTIEELYTTYCTKKAKRILSDNKHPLYSEYIRSERSTRLISKKTRTERYRKSFIPSSIRILQQTQLSQI